MKKLKELTVGNDEIEKIIDKKFVKIQSYNEEDFNSLLGTFKSDIFDTFVDDYPRKNLIAKKPEDKRKKCEAAQKTFISSLKSIDIKNNTDEKDKKEISKIKHNYCKAYRAYVNSSEFVVKHTDGLIIDKDALKNIIDANDENISKEIIENLYKFSPFIDNDKTIEKMIEKYENKNVLQNKTSAGEEKKTKVNENVESLKDSNKKLKESKERLKKEKVKLTDENKELNDKVKNLENEKSNLQNEIKNLRSDKHSNVDTTEYDNLKKEYDNLKKKLNSLPDKIIKGCANNPEKFQICLDIIAKHPIALRKIITEIDGLEDKVIENGYKYYKKRFEDEINKCKEKQAEYEEISAKVVEMQSKKGILEHYSNNSGNFIQQDVIPSYNKNNEIFKFNADDDEIFRYEEKYLGKFDDTKSVIILDNRKFIEDLHCEEIGIPICEVYPEVDWTSPEDWFGKFVGDNFVPAKTHVADYYDFIKNNEKGIPFGLVVFNNFNKILPDFYLEPFVNKLVKEKSYSIVHKNMNTDDKVFKEIKMLPNLKYILVKSQDEYAFDIPKSMRKYEIEV